MSKEQIYKTDMVWTGNMGDGSRSYKGYSRAHEISIEGKPSIVGSSDSHFNGDASRYNPEELLDASRRERGVGRGMGERRSRDNSRHFPA